MDPKDIFNDILWCCVESFGTIFGWWLCYVSPVSTYVAEYLPNLPIVMLLHSWQWFFYNLHLCFAQNYTLGDPTPPVIPINKPSFNWESQNLDEAFKIFKYQAKYLLIDGQYKSCKDQDKVGALLNWLGPKSYGIYDELDFSGGKSKTIVQYVLKAFEAYFKPTQSLSRAGINLVDTTLVHSSLKQTLCWNWRTLLMTVASLILMK